MKRLTPVKSIRAKCLDCCCQQPGEVRKCPVENCALHPFRMGHRPTSSPTHVPEKNRTLDGLFPMDGAL
jgi:hypothetical protein